MKEEGHTPFAIWGFCNSEPECIALEFNDNRVYNNSITNEWIIQWEKADARKRIEMERAYSEKELESGRGWNETRQDTIKTVLKLLN